MTYEKYLPNMPTAFMPGSLKQGVINNTSIKNNCLKLKNKVGMEVLKSKQTRVVYRDNQHIV